MSVLAFEPIRGSGRPNFAMSFNQDFKKLQQANYPSRSGPRNKKVILPHKNSATREIRPRELLSFSIVYQNLIIGAL